MEDYGSVFFDLGYNKESVLIIKYASLWKLIQ